MSHSLPGRPTASARFDGHPGICGLFLLIEARQNQSKVEKERQVDNVNLAVAHGKSGALSSQCTVILGSEATS